MVWFGCMYTTQFGGFGKQVFGSRQQLAFINGPCLSSSRLGTPFPSIHPFLTLFPCFNPIPIPLSWPFLVPLLTHFLVILLGRLQTSQLSTSKNLSSFPSQDHNQLFSTNGEPFGSLMRTQILRENLQTTRLL